MDDARAIKLLEERVEELANLPPDYKSAEFTGWRTKLFATLDAILGSGDEATQEIRDIRWWPSSSSPDEADNIIRSRKAFLDAAKEAGGILNGAIYRIREFGENPATNSQTSTLSNTKVFIVHGHDEKLRLEVEKFLTQLGLEPIVLMDKPNEGKTIIEKFEKHSDVGFAVVLATPDDIAFLAKKHDSAKTIDDLGAPEWRARQNVIFEWGFFVGKLDRDRVALIYKSPTTPPSDLIGLVHIPYQTKFEEVKMQLLTELRTAGMAAELP